VSKRIRHRIALVFIVLIICVTGGIKYKKTIKSFAISIYTKYRDTDKYVVMEAWGSRKKNIDSLKTIYDTAEGLNLVGNISNNPNRNFSKYNARAWDKSIKILAGQYENPESIRLALRPYHANWIPHYVWLVKYLMDKGYSFGSFDEIPKIENAGDATQRKVFIRYDVHVRDIAPLYGMLDVNKIYNIPSTSFLLWDYSEYEKKRKDEYISLLKFSSKLNQFGLHLSPLVSVMSDSKGDFQSYKNWLFNDGLRAYFDEILKNNAYAEESSLMKTRVFLKLWEIWHSYLGSIDGAKFVSFHGSEFDIEIRRLCAENEKYCIFKDWQVENFYISLMNKDLPDLDVVDLYGMQAASDTMEPKQLLCRINKLSEAKLESAAENICVI